jgi:hypothetical protein
MPARILAQLLLQRREKRARPNACFFALRSHASSPSALTSAKRLEPLRPTNRVAGENEFHVRGRSDWCGGGDFPP